MKGFSLLNRSVCWYLRKRYGDDVQALKPPIGYHPRYSGATITHKISYLFIRKPMWKIEKALFNKFGAAMRSSWKKPYFRREMGVK